MAGRKITNANYLDSNWQNEIESKNILKVGYFNMYLSEMETTIYPSIMPGSSIEVNGVMFYFDGPSITSPSAFPTVDGSCWLYVTDNGTNTPTVTISNTAPAVTSPNASAKGGFYLDTNYTSRAVCRMTKSGTSYSYKTLIPDASSMQNFGGGDLSRTQIGNGAYATQSAKGVAVGLLAKALMSSGTINGAVAIGDSALADDCGIAIGQSANAQSSTLNYYAVAVGKGTIAKASGVSIGLQAQTDNRSVAIGYGSISDLGGAAIGSGSLAPAGGGAVGSSATEKGGGGAVGYNAILTSTGGGGAVGYNSTSVSGFAGGKNASAPDTGVALGESASETNGGGAVGYTAYSTTGGFGGGNHAGGSTGGAGIGDHAVAVGGGAVGFYANSGSGGAVGYNTTATTGFSGGYGAVSGDYQMNMFNYVKFSTFASGVTQAVVYAWLESLMPTVLTIAQSVIGNYGNASCQTIQRVGASTIRLVHTLGSYDFVQGSSTTIQQNMSILAVKALG